MSTRPRCCRELASSAHLPGPELLGDELRREFADLGFQYLDECDGFHWYWHPAGGFSAAYQYALQSKWTREDVFYAIDYNTVKPDDLYAAVRHDHHWVGRLQPLAKAAGLIP